MVVILTFNSSIFLAISIVIPEVLLSLLHWTENEERYQIKLMKILKKKKKCNFQETSVIEKSIEINLSALFFVERKQDFKKQQI